MCGAALEMIAVEKRYGNRVALDGLDLHVATGVLFGLVGSNGAGKTTTMSITAGITRPSKGSINVLGGGAFDAARSAGRLSFIPQGALLPAYATAHDLLSFYAQLQGMSGAEARRNATEVLGWVHLSDRARSKIRALSHGMRRRIAIAQAFLGDPELVLLDEPMSGLDPREVANIRDMLTDRRGRQTIVISSHNLHEIERICDEVCFIEKGKRVRQDSLESITRQKHSLLYTLESGDVPIEALYSALPDATFRQTGPDEPGAPVLLSCEYDGDKMAAPEINTAVLRCLLDAGNGVIEIRQGSGLETAYLNASR